MKETRKNILEKLDNLDNLVSTLDFDMGEYEERLAELKDAIDDAVFDDDI